MFVGNVKKPTQRIEISAKMIGDTGVTFVLKMM